MAIRPYRRDRPRKRPSGGCGSTEGVNASHRLPRRAASMRQSSSYASSVATQNLRPFIHRKMKRGGNDTYACDCDTQIRVYLRYDLGLGHGINRLHNLMVAGSGDRVSSTFDWASRRYHKSADKLPACRGRGKRDHLAIVVTRPRQAIVTR